MSDFLTWTLPPQSSLISCDSISEFCTAEKITWSQLHLTASPIFIELFDPPFGIQGIKATLNSSTFNAQFDTVEIKNETGNYLAFNLTNSFPCGSFILGLSDQPLGLPVWVDLPTTQSAAAGDSSAVNWWWIMGASCSAVFIAMSILAYFFLKTPKKPKVERSWVPLPGEFELN